MNDTFAITSNFANIFFHTGRQLLGLNKADIF